MQTNQNNTIAGKHSTGQRAGAHEKSVNDFFKFNTLAEMLDTLNEVCTDYVTAEDPDEPGNLANTPRAIQKVMMMQRQLNKLILTLHSENNQINIEKNGTGKA